MVIVVTGASGGIGRAIAVAWAKKGASLVLSARSEGALRGVARECEAAGGKARIVVGDVTSEAHRAAVARAAEDAGGASVLVNNAGRGFYAEVTKIDLAAMRELFELNVVAPLALVQRFLPQLERARRGDNDSGGTIVMMSSIAGVVAAPRYGAYAASKFALEALARSMRAELASRGIRVVVVRPGPVATGFRANATRGEGTHGFDAQAPNAQSPETIAELTIRAVEKGAPVVETSAYVRAASAISRHAPRGLRIALKKMARSAG